MNPERDLPRIEELEKGSAAAEAGVQLSSPAPLLAWSNPPGTTWFQVQVIPTNNDGPGINLIRDADASYQLVAPVIGSGPYVLLPGMTYTWRVRASNSSAFAATTDPSWSEWTSGTFRSPSTSFRDALPARDRVFERQGDRRGLRPGQRRRRHHERPGAPSPRRAIPNRHVAR